MTVPSEEIAVIYEQDWTQWHWWIALAITAVAVAVIWFAGGFVDGSGAMEAVAWVLYSAAALVLLIVPGTLFRHIPEQGQTRPIALVAVIIAVLFLGRALFAEGEQRWFALGGAGALILGVIVGAAIDAVTRAAASVPMTVTGFVVAILVIGGVVVVASRD